MATETKEKKITKKAAPKTVKAEAPVAVDNSKFAIIETGGKQYRVSVGESVKVEKITGEFKEGDSVTFDKVLLTDTGSATTIGTPYVAGAKVTGTLTEIGRYAKVTVIKYKQKSRYFKKNGHRQPYFKVKINNIS